MQDHLIDPDCDDLMTGATAHHWQEIHKHGETTFHSDEEIRVVSKDAIMREALDELDDKGLHNKVLNTIDFDMYHICEQKLGAKMKEALNDFYGQL